MSPTYDITPNNWDQQNRLVKALLGTHESDYFYDGESRRVRIKELESGTQTKDETFVWCGSRICQKRSGSTVDRNYFEQGFEEGTSDYFYARDHLGSVREVLASDGTTVASRVSYDPWGKSTTTGSGAVADFGFTGHYFDRASGNDLTWWRGYDSHIGRWLSEDPVGLRGGSNLYGYVGGDPVNAVDESGQGIVDCAAAVAKYRRLKAELDRRLSEATNPDKGHLKAIEQLRNAVEEAANKVRRHCKEADTILEVVVLACIVVVVSAPVALSPAGAF